MHLTHACTPQYHLHSLPSILLLWLMLPLVCSHFGSSLLCPRCALDRSEAMASTVVSKALKREIAEQTRRCKQQRVEATWHREDQRQQQQELETDLIEIISELTKAPQKIASCKRAVKGNMFMPKTESTYSDTLCEAYIYLPKVPANHLELLLPKMASKLTADILKELKKKDKHILHKLLYRATLCNASNRIPDHKKEKFDEIMMARHLSFNAPLGKIQWGHDYQIDWNSSGVFALVPAKPEDEDTAQHRYTHLKLLDADLEAPASVGVGNIKLTCDWVSGLVLMCNMVRFLLSSCLLRSLSWAYCATVTATWWTITASLTASWSSQTPTSPGCPGC